MLFVSFLFTAVLIAPYLYCAKRKKTMDADRKKVQDEYNELQKELVDYYNQYDNCPIGFDYSYPWTINNIYTIIDSGRAHTISEALNLYETDTFQNNMLNQANATLQAAQEAADYAISTYYSR